MKKYLSIQNLIRAALIITGFILMVAGIWLGELTSIMRKAIIICFECIGIG